MVRDRTDKRGTATRLICAGYGRARLVSRERVVIFSQLLRLRRLMQRGRAVGNVVRRRPLLGRLGCHAGGGPAARWQRRRVALAIAWLQFRPWWGLDRG